MGAEKESAMREKISRRQESGTIASAHARRRKA
jgi:hypothetical protein